MVRQDTSKLVLMDNNILASEYGVAQLESLIGSGYAIDLNQGMDARLVDNRIANILARLKWISYIRFSCDQIPQIEAIEKVVILCEDMPEIIDVADKDPKETLLEEKEMTIGYNGMQIIPLRTKDGIIFIGEQFLEPLADEIDLLNLYERKTPKGVSYVAVKAGMMLRGIIAPYDVVTDKKFITQLELLLIDSKRELEKITISSCSTADQDDGQQSIFEDADESKEG